MERLQIDHARRIYHECYVGFTASVDFATVRATANALAGHIGMPSLGISESEIGSASAFEKYQRLMRLAPTKLRPGEVWYDPRTPHATRTALESARCTRRKIRIHYGDPKTGLDRMAIQDVVGFVGNAGWQLPCPILLSERNIHIGPRICEPVVVRVVDVDGMFAPYQHDSYRLPEFSTVSVGSSDAPEKVLLSATASRSLNAPTGRTPRAGSSSSVAAHTLHRRFPCNSVPQSGRKSSTRPLSSDG